jgi:hypothetical protein
VWLFTEPAKPQLNYSILVMNTIRSVNIFTKLCTLSEGTVSNSLRTTVRHAGGGGRPGGAPGTFPVSFSFDLLRH